MNKEHAYINSVCISQVNITLIEKPNVSIGIILQKIKERISL